MRTAETVPQSPQIVIIDFESQLARVIAARYGEMGVRTEVVKHNEVTPEDLERFGDPEHLALWLVMDHPHYFHPTPVSSPQRSYRSQTVNPQTSALRRVSL